MAHATPPTGVRVLSPSDGEILGPREGTHDRILLAGSGSAGRFAVVEHTLAPGDLAAPLHLHTREDEYSFVLEGRMGAVLGEQEVFAAAGDFVFKPRDQWHTFWNAADSTTRILELISPAGLEDLFRTLADGMPEPEVLVARAAEFGAQLDFEGTLPIVERHRLNF